MAWQGDEFRAAADQETREIGRALPFCALAESGGGNPQNPDAALEFPFLKEGLGIVVGAAAGQDGDCMTALGQAQGEISQILSSGDDVRIEGLVKQKNSHG